MTDREHITPEQARELGERLSKALAPATRQVHQAMESLASAAAIAARAMAAANKVTQDAYTLMPPPEEPVSDETSVPDVSPTPRAPGASTGVLSATDHTEETEIR